MTELTQDRADFDKALNDGLGQEDKQNAALMPCGTAVTNVYDAYAAGAKAEREACAKEVEDYAKRHARDDDDTKAQAWMMLQCASQILKRSNV